jgi:hypothetical protein
MNCFDKSQKITYKADLTTTGLEEAVKKRSKKTCFLILNKWTM